MILFYICTKKYTNIFYVPDIDPSHLSVKNLLKLSHINTCPYITETTATLVSLARL